VLINGINISNFKAKLMDRNIKSAEFEIENEWIINSLNPLIQDKFGYKYKTLTFTLDILCSDANELEIMKSNLTKQLAISTIKFDDIEYYYRGFMSGTPSTKYIMRGNETLEVNMLVVAEKEQISESMNRITTKTINVPGNLETSAIVEITPSVSIIDIVLTGLSDEPITIKTLTGSRKLIIDGEEGKVTVDGINKFGDTDMWEFPRLKPGANTITVSRNNVDISIKYKPRFI
jgi:phage-related protein